MEYIFIPIAIAILIRVALTLKTSSPVYTFITTLLPLATVGLFALPSFILSETQIIPYYHAAADHPIMFLVPLSYLIASLVALSAFKYRGGLFLAFILLGYAGFWTFIVMYGGAQLADPSISFLLTILGQTCLPLIALLGVLLPAYQKAIQQKKQP